MQEQLWHPDELGPEFIFLQQELPADEHGPRQATLIHHLPKLNTENLNNFVTKRIHTPQAESTHKSVNNSSQNNALGQHQTSGQRETSGKNNIQDPNNLSEKLPKFALLAVHGWNDYFYQAEFARFITELGGSFYALDLSRYGRSHREDELLGFTTDLGSYDADFRFGLDTIREIHGSDIPIVLYGHSTGGLSTTLWASENSSEISGLILNSPWFGIPHGLVYDFLFYPLVRLAAKVSPTTVIPMEDLGLYYRTGQGNHLNTPGAKLEEDPQQDPFYTTGWNPNPEFRRNPSFPVRTGWLSAIWQGQEQLRSGLNVTVPVLTLTSDKHFTSREWDDQLLEADSVLDVEKIWDLARLVGPDVEIHRIHNGVHDLVLSRASARKNVYSVIETWLKEKQLLNK